MARRSGSDGNNAEGDELDPAVDDHWRYKKSLSVVSCIDKRIK